MSNIIIRKMRSVDLPQVMQIGASAALESPNMASRSAEEWISADTSRAEAAPAPDETAEASRDLPDSPAP